MKSLLYLLSLCIFGLATNPALASFQEGFSFEAGHIRKSTKLALAIESAPEAPAIEYRPDETPLSLQEIETAIANFSDGLKALVSSGESYPRPITPQQALTSENYRLAYIAQERRKLEQAKSSRNFWLAYQAEEERKKAQAQRSQNFFLAYTAEQKLRKQLLAE